ncbi:MAG: sodium:solute symporter [Gemmatimonadetes bacterium]|nr:sodium:solute symporter [Gemmatimonadota bacterium]MYC93127.1 sodium:solute symporter [Gemmatimonadota bacterium]MYG36516.1 sodium:solute symporter [Gemmatimonadota bacterium]MYJ18384.1 sodium:solute symporter [Gemmatimonadota bacterium]
MHPINWLIVGVYVAYVLVDGIRRARGTNEIEGYFLASRTLPWWAVGLSVMATQLSAVTMIGTTGQGATDGLRFVQFYFGLPLAMVILGVTLVPFLRGAGVYTAYEYLERRFGPETRTLTALLFLLSRGMSCGVIIAAPAVVFSAIFGWPLIWCVALIGIPTVAYTMLGGIQAVTWADVKQMILIVFALLAVVVVLIVQMPVSPGEALHIAGATGRLKVFDFSFNINETYTFWSGLIGGTFLMLSYFGTDQSQVQRYLAAKSVDAARTSLLMSAYWKIPLQALVLLVGVMVFVYYQFQPAPLLYNPAHEVAVVDARGAEYQALQDRYGEAFELREGAARRAAGLATPEAAAGVPPGAAAAPQAAPTPVPATAQDAARQAAMNEFLSREAAVQEIRAEALAMAEDVTGEPSRDVNYIIPRFVLGELPIGLAGLFIAAIIAAAMSSISSELNSLSTTSIIDFYRRWFRPEASDAHYLTVSKVTTAFWGVFACFVAVYAVSLGSLIEVVNRFGSFFYGSILGVFLLAMVPRARGLGAFAGLIAGMAAVAAVTFGAPSVSFLWHNVIGALTVLAVGVVLMRRTASPPGRGPAR